MKALLQLVCVTGLTGGMLYPLVMNGVQMPVNILLEAGLLLAGCLGLTALYRFRKKL